MKRVTKIYEHPYYQECLKRIEKAEKDRIFCCHDMQHFLDVARLAYIFSVERGYDVPKAQIYGAALLHDIGKWQQYEEGTPHEMASAVIAERLLEETEFTEEEKEGLLKAILEHRKKSPKTSTLSEILYDADKASRNCFLCKAKDNCNWDTKKKNLEIRY